MKSIEEMMKAAQEAAATVQAQMQEAQAKLDSVEVEDLLAAAFNDAREKADRVSNEEMGKMTSGLPLPPGFKLPF